MRSVVHTEVWAPYARMGTRCYAEGRGVERDNRQATQWARAYVTRGPPPAGHRTPAGVGESQLMAALEDVAT